jgi:gamma-glutamyltranspeptidase/glutathione hydrolase
LTVTIGAFLATSTGWADVYPGSIFDLSFRYTTYKPQLHGKEWMAVTGEPLSAMAGAKIFVKGGNAADAAAAMLAAVCVLNDSISFGGETPALVYDPVRKKVFAINGQGLAPTGATPEFFRSKGMDFPPGYGPLAATTPGTPGALIVMLAEFGTMSLKDVLAPAIDLAEGYPIEKQTAAIYGENKAQFEKWAYSKEVFLPGGQVPEPGQIIVQKDLANMFRKLVEAEQKALKAKKNRKQALMAAHDRFYKGDIAAEYVRASREYGGLHTLEDLAKTKARVEEPLHVNYRGIDVYKCNSWTQGPTLLQMLNILEGFDIKSMKHNSPEYIHTIYQVMNLAYADRDFYYGDPDSTPKTPMKGLLSKEYAAERRKLINWEKNNPVVLPGDPYPYQGEKNPFEDLLKENKVIRESYASLDIPEGMGEYQTHMGTTSIVAADKKGWLVSVTPSGGWPPAFIAGKTGVGMSQRMQQFVLDRALNPFNVVAPGKRPRITITPSMALKDGVPYLAFALPGGDVQEQMLLQFFLDVVEFGYDLQDATEAPKFEAFQMQGSFGNHPAFPGRISLDTRISKDVFDALATKGYKPVYWKGGVKGEHAGAFSTLRVDHKHKSLEGGQGLPDGQWSGVRYGIGW